MARTPTLPPWNQIVDDAPLRLGVAGALAYTDGGENGDGGRAAALNAQVDERNTKRKGGQITAGRIAAYGTVDWLLGRAIVGIIDPS
jgi:hypothetical protein